MSHKLAIDFGTTNTVVTHWDETRQQAEVLALDELSQTISPALPPIIPSLVYVAGHDHEYVVGDAVCRRGLDRRRDHRLFRNFKRGIVGLQTPEARHIDGAAWHDRDAGRIFLRQVVRALPYDLSEVEQLVMSTPVTAFETYINWLNETLEDIPREHIRVVDESTAAALGYAITRPSAVVLVFDFGGGTLDLSLVQLPESGSKSGGMLLQLLKLKNRAQHAAKVIAKTGSILGGSDVDRWLLDEVLQRSGLTFEEVGDGHSPLLTACEQAKILLSQQEVVEIGVEGGERRVTVPFSREDLEALLERHGFYAALHRMMDKVLYLARQRGVYGEDIHSVLMVGGTSLMPSVRRVVEEYFAADKVCFDKPFTAIAEGALQLALGVGLQDLLTHSYGLRHLENGRHTYTEIIPMGSPYPSERPFEIILQAAHAGQKAIECVLGEIDADSVGRVEVRFENGEAVFMAQAAGDEQPIVPMNADVAVLAELDPPGVPGEDRLRVCFRLDERGQLYLNAQDLKTGREVLQNAPVAQLR